MNLYRVLGWGAAPRVERGPSVTPPERQSEPRAEKGGMRHDARRRIRFSNTLYANSPDDALKACGVRPGRNIECRLVRAAVSVNG